MPHVLNRQICHRCRHNVLPLLLLLPFSSKQAITSAGGKAGRHEHSLKHMSANMAVNFKSNLFSRQELRKIDVHISSINGFYNSPACWTGSSLSSSSKLWQVYSQFSWLIDNQTSPVSMSRCTLWSETGDWGKKAAWLYYSLITKPEHSNLDCLVVMSYPTGEVHTNDESKA